MTFDSVLDFALDNPAAVLTASLALLLFLATNVIRKLERRSDRRHAQEKEAADREREQEKEAEKLKEDAQQARENAKSSVVEEYLRNARSHFDTHITGLIRAEITALETDGEVRDVIAIIERREQGHPIPRQERENLLDPRVDLLCAFRKWREIGYGKPNPPKQFREVVAMCRNDE